MISLLTRYCGVVLGITLAAALLAPSAKAITHRNDVPESSYIDLASSQIPFLAVGYMTASPNTGAYASATLIAPNWILTAAHAVTGFPVYSFKLNGSTYLADAQYYHPEWTGNLEHGNDIALVHLSSSVVGVEPALLYGGNSEVGKVGVSVGYGLGGTGTGGYTGAAGTKRASENIIDGYADTYPFGPPINHNIIVSDFDNPNGNGNILGSLGYSSSATPLALEGSIAPGDSGGATFVLDGGIWQVAGVHSFISAEEAPLGDGAPNAQYNEWFGSTLVSPYIPWIEDTTGLNTVVVPEPGTFSLFALPAIAFLIRRRKRS